jgi:hypothetical protein
VRFARRARSANRGSPCKVAVAGWIWPPPAGAPKRSANQNAANAGFKVFDFDVLFYGPELAVACFNVNFGQKSGGDIITGTRYRIMDIYAKRQYGHHLHHVSVRVGTSERRTPHQHRTRNGNFCSPRWRVGQSGLASGASQMKPVQIKVKPVQIKVFENQVDGRSLGVLRLVAALRS